MKPYTRICVVAILLWTIPSTVRSKTIFSFGGLGDPVRRVDARAVGMGGAGLALADGFNFSTANPAVLGAIRVASMDSRYVIQRRSVKNADGLSHTLSDSDIGALRVALPIRQGSVLGIGLEPLTDMDFSLTDSVSTGSLPHRLRVSGTGGVQAVALGLAQSYKGFYVGARLDLVAIGTVSEIWKREFGSTLKTDADGRSNVEYLNTSDHFLRTYRGVLPAVGAVFRPGSGWYLGLSFQPRRTITQTETLKNVYAESGFQEGDEVKSDVDMPASIGLGAAYNGGYKWLAALDLVRTYWGSTGPGRHDTVELAAGGLYRLGSDDVMSRRKRIELMGGFHYRSMHYATVSSEKLTEKGLSMGVMVPLKRGGGGRIHYVIEFGTRGDTDVHGISERYVMQTISISGFLR